MIVQDELSNAITEYYMPYAMKVITDRALPDVKDGLKPIARRILWIMWKNGLKYNLPRNKCGKIVGDVLTIHNHGDISIYNALALLTEQNESLSHPFVDGEGGFGKIYSKDSPSAMRYTSARLNKFSEEMFNDINKNVVKFIGEDKEHTQPLTLPNTIPYILLKPNSGLAVGEACNWCSFNLQEICDLTLAYMKDTNIKVIDYLSAPDFTTGGSLISKKENLEKIYADGRGSFRLQAKYRYEKSDNSIEVYEIPYNTTVEDIIKDINKLIQNGRVKDINDVKDGTGFNEKLKKEIVGISIELKKNSNPDMLMKMLYRHTRLTTSFSCNFNCLVDYKPRVLGIKETLNEWLSFRRQSIQRATQYDINKKSEQLHLLEGLEKVLSDIDKVIQIIRQSKNDDLVISNLIKEFNIDEIQANEIANIKLRNLNKNYMLNRAKPIKTLQGEIKNLQSILSSEDKINEIISKDIERVRNTYSIPRRTEILYEDTNIDTKPTDFVEDSTITLILTKHQYLKKTQKYSENQFVKDGDEVLQIIQTTNKKDLLLFTNQGRVYTRKIYELSGRVECQPSSQGEYIPNLIKDLQPNEKIIYIASPENYDKGYMLYTFQNSNILKMAMNPYSNKQNRQVAQDAYLYEEANPLRYIKYITEDIDLLAVTTEGKALIINTNEINPKTSNGGKKSQGNPFIRLESSKFKNNSVVEIVFEPTTDNKFTVTTEKREFEFGLNDIADNGKIQWEYLQGKRMNSGNMIYNCRQKKDRITGVS